MIPPHDCTVVVPLSGRWNCWRLLRQFLRRVLDASNHVNLVLIDSGDQDFSNNVRQWASTVNCPVLHTALEARPRSPRHKNLADAPRHEVFAEVNQAMVQIYSWVQNRIKDGTLPDDNYLWIIEDDIIPPDHAFNSLALDLDDPGVFSTSGAYQVRKYNRWAVWRDLNQELIRQPGEGSEVVAATGLGCLLTWARNFIKIPMHWEPRPTPNPDWPWGYDMEFFKNVREQQLGDVVVSWDVVCPHLNE